MTPAARGAPARLESGASLWHDVVHRCVMGEVINLNQARKARARDEAARRSAENRAFFGRTKSERERMQAEREKQSRDLDGAKLEE